MIREDLEFLVKLDESKLDIILEVARELDRATNLHGKMASAHEGYSVILEELDELKEEIWKKREQRSITRMRKEAIQVSAMGARFCLDILNRPKDMLDKTKVAGLNANSGKQQPFEYDPSPSKIIGGVCMACHCNITKEDRDGAKILNVSKGEIHLGCYEYYLSHIV